MLRKTLLTVAVLLLLCGAELLAQSNIDDMEARAYVFRPIVLERTSNLIFGSVTVGDQAGTVVIAQNGNRSNSGGVGLVQSTHSAANVTITAQSYQTLIITLPATTILSDGGSNTLNMTFDPSHSGFVDTNESGILNMQIGGTVEVPAATPIGTYSGTVELSVVYF